MACEPLSIQLGLSVAATSYAVCMDSPLALRDEHQQFLWRVVAVFALGQCLVMCDARLHFGLHDADCT